MSETLFRVAREYDVVKVKVPKDVQERADKEVAEGICLGCKRKLEADERRTCGNCATCYNAVLEKPASVRIKLIQRGETLNPTKGGRKHANKFTEKLAEM